jgi:hypothetical protein
MLTKKPSNDSMTQNPKTIKATKTEGQIPSASLYEHLSPQGKATPLSASKAQPQTSGEKKTRIVVRYDVGFPNTLYIRGKGAELTWNRGIPMRNVKPDEWVWETSASFSGGEFKVLINDRIYESGQNHLLSCGASIQYTPQF